MTDHDDDDHAARVERMVLMLEEAGLDAAQKAGLKPSHGVLGLMAAAGIIATSNGWTEDFIRAVEDLVRRMRAQEFVERAAR